jgi:hypothetical protein
MYACNYFFFKAQNGIVVHYFTPTKGAKSVIGLAPGTGAARREC